MLICWLAFSKAKSRSYLVAVGVIAITGVLSVVLTGKGWPWISYYARYLIMALLAAYFAFRFCEDLWAVATAARYEGTPLAVHFPLRGGRFVVTNAGANEKLNGHFPVTAQRYALDIVALGKWKTRALGLYPAEVTKYAVYGADVVAPCTGIVAAAVDGLPDLMPGEMDPKNLLGEVGNTGNTSEPHLHIHVVRGRLTDIQNLAGTGQPVPMLFDGRFLSRNDVVNSPVP